MDIRSSRRQFLQVSAGAVGAAFAVNAIPLESAPLGESGRQVSASDRVRFGMIGVGMQGSGLLARSIALPGVECAAACDLYDGRHARAREIAGANLRTTRRYQELLADKEIDCIVAAVPDHWHRKIVVDAVSAGKDIYCEKPMSHSVADGHAMVAAAQKSGRIVQIGSQRTSSVLCAKARELVAQGMLGELQLVEGSLGRNDPTGAWVYPPPPDLSPSTVDWDTWQGDVPKRALDPKVFARWRCWKEYGTGVAGDLMVHLISGMLFTLGDQRGAHARGRDGRHPPVQRRAQHARRAHVALRVPRRACAHPLEPGVRDSGGAPLSRIEGHPRARGDEPDVFQSSRRGYRPELLRVEFSGAAAGRVLQEVARRARSQARRGTAARRAQVPGRLGTTTPGRISGSSFRP